MINRFELSLKKVAAKQIAVSIGDKFYRETKIMCDFFCLI